VINSSQRPPPDNTQHLKQTNVHALGGIRTHNLSRRANADLRLRLRGHWDRLTSFLGALNTGSLFHVYFEYTVPRSWVGLSDLFLKGVMGCPGGCRLFILKDTIKGTLCIYISDTCFVMWTVQFFFKLTVPCIIIQC